MMTRSEAIKCFEKWFDDGCVGNLTYFRSPRAASVDAVIEETIKLREFSDDDRRKVEDVFNVLSSEKVEMYRDRDGYPDRVKVVRRP
jgi:hypothetical protein